MKLKQPPERLFRLANSEDQNLWNTAGEQAQRVNKGGDPLISNLLLLLLLFLPLAPLQAASSPQSGRAPATGTSFAWRTPLRVHFKVDGQGRTISIYYRYAFRTVIAFTDWSIPSLSWDWKLIEKEQVRTWFHCIFCSPLTWCINIYNGKTCLKILLAHSLEEGEGNCLKNIFNFPSIIFYIMNEISENIYFTLVLNSLINKPRDFNKIQNIKKLSH